MQRPSPSLVDTRFTTLASPVLLVLCLKVSWGQVCEGRVKAITIVEDFDIPEDGCPRFASGLVALVVHQFTLQAAEETLHGRIIVPSANTIHTRCHPMLFQQSLIFLVSVLAAL